MVTRGISGFEGVSLSSHDSGSATLLSVRNLRTYFDVGGHPVKAVDGVSFDVGVGTTLGIVGESGSGKTVLSRSIMGINTAGNATTTGSVQYNGSELIGKTRRELRHFWGEEMAMVFQDPMTSLNPVVRIGRQLTEHLRAHKNMSKAEAEEVAIQLLTWVRIPEPKQRLANYPHQMSGGMRQRVCIAIALACSPQLLFADEPTTALDVTVQHQILNLLSQQQVELWSIPKTSEPKHTRLSAIIGRPPNLAALPVGCSFADRCPYVQPICREVEPDLQSDGGHAFACHLPVGSAAADVALSENAAAGLAQSQSAAARRESNAGVSS